MGQKRGCRYKMPPIFLSWTKYLYTNYIFHLSSQQHFSQLLPFLGTGKAVEQTCPWGKEICLELLGFLPSSWEKVAHCIASTGTENQNKLMYSLWSSFPLLESQNCVTAYHQTNSKESRNPTENTSSGILLLEQD